MLGSLKLSQTVLLLRSLLSWIRILTAKYRDLHSKSPIISLSSSTLLLKKMRAFLPSNSSPFPERAIFLRTKNSPLLSIHSDNTALSLEFVKTAVSTVKRLLSGEYFNNLFIVFFFPFFLIWVIHSSSSPSRTGRLRP